MHKFAYFPTCFSPATAREQEVECVLVDAAPTFFAGSLISEEPNLPITFIY